MKKTFYLEGERITLKQTKELLGDARYEKVMKEAKAAFLSDPLTEIAYMTHQGVLTVYFQVG